MTVDLEVRNLVGAYCNEVTSGDPEPWSMTWSADAVWGIPGGGTINGRAAIREQFAAVRSTYLLCVQAILSATIEPDGPDRATARHYIRELQWKDVDGAVRHSELIGWYDDTIVRDDDGAMRFARRNFTLLTSGPLPWEGRFHRAAHELRISASGSA
jgi:hypothetical protein